MSLIPCPAIVRRSGLPYFTIVPLVTSLIIDSRTQVRLTPGRLANPCLISLLLFARAALTCPFGLSAARPSQMLHQSSTGRQLWAPFMIRSVLMLPRLSTRAFLWQIPLVGCLSPAPKERRSTAKCFLVSCTSMLQPLVPPRVFVPSPKPHRQSVTHGEPDGRLGPSRSMAPVEPWLLSSFFPLVALFSIAAPPIVLTTGVPRNWATICTNTWQYIALWRF